MPEQQDPRAYSGSQAGSLEEILKEFSLELPSCEPEKVGFSGNATFPGQKLNLSFRAPKRCVDSFLAEHQVDVADPAHWPSGGGRDGDRVISPTEPPFVEKDMKRFGWKLDPSREYNFYDSFKTANGSLFRVLIDPRDAVQTVYMVSTTVGGG
ncbi:hypothetical protein [Streptomyces abikoensis]|uniref:hypothetical protein n=1 Tax=Streptomyces abikoensis TaxID=97398 RepID=UPI0036821691